MDAIEKRARELLAAEYERFDLPSTAAGARAGAYDLNPSMRAVVAALTPPAEPDQALLVSMAMCLDHGFGMATLEQQESRLRDMRKLWDEVMGRGYYSPENRERYIAMLAARPEAP